MNSWGWSIVFLSLLCGVWIGILSVRRTQKTMDTIEQMLDQAMKGEFSENSFDESRLSALENRFAQFFLASFVSARRVAEEKDKNVDCGHFPSDQNADFQSSAIL